MYVAWKYCWVGKATHTALCGIRARLAGSLNTRLRYLVMPGTKKHRNTNSRLGCSLLHSYSTAIKAKPNAASAASVLEDEVDMLALGELEIGIEENYAQRAVAHHSNML